MSTAAHYEPTSGEAYRAKDRMAFYKLAPVKGARVEGVVGVAVTSHEVNNHQRYNEKVTCPAMRVDYTPDFAEGNGRQTIVVNGRTYGEGFASSESGYVEFHPITSDEHREHISQYYLTATVDGQPYYLRPTVSFSSLTDKARDVLGATMAALAQDFVTDARWHDHKVAQATYRVESAQRDATKANEALHAAQAALAELMRKG